MSFNLSQIAHAAETIQSNAGIAATQTSTGLEGFFVTVWGKVPYFFAAVIVIIVAWIVAKYARQAAEKALMRSSQNPGALDLVGKSAQVGVISTGLFIALQIMDIDLTLMIGAFSFGLGFALKDMISNYLAGIFILIQQPFKVGDLIKVKDTLGFVQAIEGRNITIKSVDGQKVIVSNNTIFHSQVTNLTHHPERRIILPMGVDFRSDLPTVTRVIEEVLAQHKAILKKPVPQVIYTEFGTSTINLEIRFWVSIMENWFQIRSEIITQIKKAFDENNIHIPFPIRTLHTETGNPLNANIANVPENKTITHKPTSALGTQNKVSSFGSTDDFDPQANSKATLRNVEPKQEPQTQANPKPQTNPTEVKPEPSPKSKPEPDDVFDAKAESEK